MKRIVPALFVFLLCSCSEPCISVDERLQPGTFNLSTVITDSEGNSLDLAGDWAVFQDPDEIKFTNYIHYEQTTQTSFSVLDNTVFMLDLDQGLETMPVYDNGNVNKPRSFFFSRGTSAIIYKDGRVHLDLRSNYILYNSPYGSPDLHVVIDDDTLTLEDLPNVRLRRIKAFDN